MKSQEEKRQKAEAKEQQKEENIQDTIHFDIPTIYVQDHCPKCKGAEQRLQVSGIEHRIVNCSEDMSEAEKLNLTETPTIVDPDGTMFVGANAAAEWMKYHNTK